MTCGALGGLIRRRPSPCSDVAARVLLGLVLIPEPEVPARGIYTKSFHIEEESLPLRGLTAVQFALTVIATSFFTR